MSERNKFLVPIGFSVVLCLGLIAGYAFHPDVNSQRAQKLEDILALLDKNYVDSIDKEVVFTSAIQDLLHKLDPHSRYISSKDLQSENESINASFGGIGVRFQIIKDTVCITHVLDNSPSMQAGIKSGDKIIAINGKPFIGKKITNEKTMKLLKGDEGTDVSVSVCRGQKKIKIALTRAEIPIQTISASYMIDGQIGYIKIDQFSIPTAEEFHEASVDLLDKGMDKLILDLRGNPGGVLETSTKIADEFLKSGLTIVSTKGKTFKTITEKATEYGVLENTELVLLIDQGSASASEILAGAIQDNDRGTIIGRRSFGKGLVQQDQMLSDGSSVRMTIARYYTPVGRCIQRSYDGDYNSYLRDEERISRGELFHSDAIPFNKEEKFKTKGGKILYGGGGIAPDIFVPIDTTGHSMYFTELQINMVFSAFAFDFLQFNRNRWRTPLDLNKFEVSPILLSKFTEYASKNFKIPVAYSELNTSKKLISQTIKEELARQLWQENGFFQISNPQDRDVKKAIEYFLKKA